MARGRTGTVGTGSPRGPRIGIAQAKLHGVITTPRHLPRSANDNQRRTLSPRQRGLALMVFVGLLGAALLAISGT